MEADHLGLSTRAWQVVPLQRTTQALAAEIGVVKKNLTLFKTTIHEDNEGCIVSAKLEPGWDTPRSKHHAVKCHWFRAHLRPDAEGVVKTKVVKIDAKVQKTNIFATGLRTVHFKQKHHLLCEWQPSFLCVLQSFLTTVRPRGSATGAFRHSSKTGHVPAMLDLQTRLDGFQWDWTAFGREVFKIERTQSFPHNCQHHPLTNCH